VLPSAPGQHVDVWCAELLCSWFSAVRKSIVLLVNCYCGIATTCYRYVLVCDGFDLEEGL
jgi:hypothetical protein